MEELREKLARIDENVKFLKKQFDGIPGRVGKVEREMALFKRDQKWFLAICSAVSAGFAVVGGWLLEWFRR